VSNRLESTALQQFIFFVIYFPEIQRIRAMYLKVGSKAVPLFLTQQVQDKHGHTATRNKSISACTS